MSTVSNIGSGRHITYSLPQHFINEDLALLVGLHAGDGFISHGIWGLRCNIRDKNMYQMILRLIRKVLGVEPNIGLWNNAFEIRSGQKQVVDFFKTYGFLEGKKAYDAKIPDALAFSKNPKIIKGVLRGLFSSDGSFSFQRRCHSPRIDFTVRSEILRNQFIYLASNIGFSLNKCDPMRVSRGYTINSTGKFFNANLTSKASVVKWMKKVGTICDSHVKRYDRWKSFKIV